MRAALVTVSVGLACALSVSMARAQDSSHALPEYTRRSLVLPSGQFVGRIGIGLAGSNTPTGTFIRSAFGAGLHFEGQAGLGRSFELSAGWGLRLPSDGETLAADRYARVDREEVFQVGSVFIGNPYARLRYGIIDAPDRAVHAGAEVTLVFPLAALTVWSVGFGMPVHLTVSAAHMRIETGLFWQFILSGNASIWNVLNIPVRVMFQLGSSFALGAVSGVYIANVGAADVSSPRVPLGVQAAIRIAPSTDLLVQWLFPTIAPYGTDYGGLGITVAGRAR